MDEELAQLLDLNSLDDVKSTFAQHKVHSIRAVKMISDAQFESMGVAIGQVATIKAALSEGSTGKIKDRIRELVEKIRKSESNKEKGKSKPMNSKLVTKKPARQRKIFVGWLHRSSTDSRFTQVRTKDGGSLRQMTYNDDDVDAITVDFLKKQASRLFFPEGVSKLGALTEMFLELGNFAQDSITAFTDTNGKECTFQEYLRDRGLFANRFKVYLMTTLIKEENSRVQSDSSQEEDCMLVSASLSSDSDKTLSSIDVSRGCCSKSQVSGDVDAQLMITSTQKRNVSRDLAAKESHTLYGLALKEDEGTLCSAETMNEHRLNIAYEDVKESSYSEVILRTISYSRQECYELNCLSEPLTHEIALNDFEPLEHGFTVVEISKEGGCFLDKRYESLDDDFNIEQFGYVYPQADQGIHSRLILHPPSEIWGYDGNKLIIGVVASCHMAANSSYIWYQNGSILRQGRKVCCLAINEPGVYNVEVQCGEVRDVSEPVFISSLSSSEPCCSADENISNTKLSNTKRSEGDEKVTLHQKATDAPLTVVDKEEIKFSIKDEIGRGSFGVVYKGLWAGTQVAVKHTKVRNAKRIWSVLQTEVRLHSMVRHPNIVQIMAVSLLKNSIYIVSEYIEGLNLEELLFGDGENSQSFTIQSCDKLSVAKELCQAVAYLHNLKPPIVHRDIKPANVLVAKATHITKVCDMGLSKLRSTQSLSQTTSLSIPGTPHYMAPECVLEKRKATVLSDVWSLACTLVELFSEQDCWEEILENTKDITGEDCDVDSLIVAIRNKASPQASKLLPGTIGSLQQVLADCFQYDFTKRPCAIDIINAFN